MSKPNLKWQEIKPLAKEILYNSIAQAILKIIDTPFIVLKIFLFIFVLISTAFSAYLVVQSFFAYFAYEVVTTTRTLSETPAPFPKITICNYNQFVTRDAIEFIKKINSELYPEYDIFNETQMNALNYSTKYTLIENIYSAATSQMLMPTFTDNQRKSLGHSLDDILISCSFNGVECSFKDFTWTFDTLFGNCFVFNTKQSFVGGSLYGLSIKYYIGFNDELILFNSIGGASGYVRIENSSYLMDTSLDNDLYLRPGTNTYVDVERKFQFYLPKPFSPCQLPNDDSYEPTLYFSSHLLATIYHSPYIYTRSLCFYQCIQNEIKQMCNCTSVDFLSLFESVKGCFTEDEISCKDNVTNSFTETDLIKVINNK
jgi:hypothetical protein